MVAHANEQEQTVDTALLIRSYVTAAKNGDVRLLQELVGLGLDLKATYPMSAYVDSPLYILYDCSYYTDFYEGECLVRCSEKRSDDRQLSPINFYLNGADYYFNFEGQIKAEVPDAQERASVSRFSKEFLVALIDLGSSIWKEGNVEDAANSPLHLALTFDNDEAAKILLSYGALKKEGQEELFSRNSTALVLIQDRSRKGYGQAKMLPMIKLLVEAGTDVNHANRDGVTPLIMAAMNHYPSIVNYLLKSGATKSIPAIAHRFEGMTEQFTALHAAVGIWFHQEDFTPQAVFDTVKILVNAGADVNSPNDNYSITPLDVVYMWLPGYKQVPELKALNNRIAKYLISKGAKRT